MPDNKIKEFYGSDSYLLIGMSKKKKNFAWGIYKSFTESGRTVLPLHPDGGDINGVKLYARIEDLPEKSESCIICADVKKNTDIIPELVNSGIRRFWFQQGSYNEESLEQARKHNARALTGCVLMYLPEASFPHKLHRFFHELFSKGRN